MEVPDLLVLQRFLANFGEDSLPYQVGGLLQHKADAHLEVWFYTSTTCAPKLQILLLFPSTRKKNDCVNKLMTSLHTGGPANSMVIYWQRKHDWVQICWQSAYLIFQSEGNIAWVKRHPLLKQNCHRICVRLSGNKNKKKSTGKARSMCGKFVCGVRQWRYFEEKEPFPVYTMTGNTDYITLQRRPLWLDSEHPPPLAREI